MPDDTIIGLKRHDELTRRIQEKRAKAAEATDPTKPAMSTLLAAQRKRARTARGAIKETKANVIEISKDAVA